MYVCVCTQRKCTAVIDFELTVMVRERSWTLPSLKVSSAARYVLDIWMYRRVAMENRPTQDARLLWKKPDAAAMATITKRATSRQTINLQPTKGIIGNSLIPLSTKTVTGIVSLKGD